MAESRTPLIEIIYRNDGSRKVFYDLESAITWIGQEREFWSWVDGMPSTNHQYANQFLARWRDSFNKFRDLANSANNVSLTEDQRMQSLNQLKSAAQVLGDRAVLSTSPTGKFISDLHIRRGPITSFGALGTFVGWPDGGDGGRTEQDRLLIAGMVETMLHQNGVNSKSSALARKAMEELFEEHSQSSLNLVEEFKLKIAEAEKAIVDFVEKGGSSIGEIQDDGREFFEEESQTFQRLASDFEILKKTYETHMSLKAPVEYWKNRAAEHERRIESATGWLAIASICSAILLFVIFTWVSINIGTEIKLDHFFYVAVALFSTTACLWILRVLLKIVLSERHLRNYAEEKSMLLQTYLALTGVDKTEKDDRQIVLASIFSSTADGIVKDDSGPDITISAILAKLLSK
ncbi:DUF6161 domain-containing protein [Aestuariivirga sp.]|uniref:DUF6161 domain-containing protein n=1 Tax=Aestuariivirga sp. TaxID=2650926 RepID=UPI0039E42A6F